MPSILTAGFPGLSPTGMVESVVDALAGSWDRIANSPALICEAKSKGPTELSIGATAASLICDCPGIVAITVFELVLITEIDPSLRLGTYRLLMNELY